MKLPQTITTTKKEIETYAFGEVLWNDQYDQELTIQDAVNDYCREVYGNDLNEGDTYYEIIGDKVIIQPSWVM